jgi:hypothetical protein
LNTATNFANGTYAFRAYTIDLEITKQLDAGCWSFLGTFGARYARLEQDQTLVAAVPGSVLSAFASNHTEGTGLTSALEARRALGDSNWSVFANVRGSVLWGSDYVAAGASVNTTAVAEDRANGDTLWIVEAQIGLEWSQPLKCICGTVFVRGAYEYQRWTDTQAAVQDPISVAPPNSNVDFNGLAFAVGFSR